MNQPLALQQHVRRDRQSKNAKQKIIERKLELKWIIGSQ